MEFYSKNSGQSLIELLVALTLAMIVIVAVVGLATVSIKTSYFAKRETKAKRYAEEAMEWLREEKKKSWFNFSNRAGTNGETYCLPDLSWPISSSGCSLATLEGIYKRDVTLEKSTDGKVNATVVVSWTDSAGTHETKLVSVFTRSD